MIHTKKETIEHEVIEKMECDGCHAIVLADDIMEWQEWLQIKFCGGFNSIFGDEVIMETQLCQQCVSKLLGSVLRESKENFEEENE
jgi:hypothetical protein